MTEVEEILKSPVVAWDFETFGEETKIPFSDRTQAQGSSLAWIADGKYKTQYWTFDFYAYGANKVSWRWFEDTLARPLWNDPEKTLVYHNARYDLQVAMRLLFPRMDVSEVLDNLPKAKVEDTMVLAFMVDENMPKSLKDLSRIYLDKPRDTYEQTHRRIQDVLDEGKRKVAGYVELGWKMYKERQKSMDLFVDLPDDELKPFLQVLSKFPVGLKLKHFREKCAELFSEGIKEQVARQVDSELLTTEGEAAGKARESMIEKRVKDEMSYLVNRGWELYSTARDPEKLTKFGELVAALPAGYRKEHFCDLFEAKIRDRIINKSREVADGLMKTYAEEDSLDTLQLWELLFPKLTKEEERWYRKVELPFALLMCELEIGGVRMDLDYLSVMEDDGAALVEKKFAEIQSKVQERWGLENFNPRSSPQIKQLLWDRLKLTPPRWAKTGKSGEVSTDAEVQQYLADKGVDVCKDLLEYAGLSKLYGTYLRPLRERAERSLTQTIRTSFNSVGTVTGRISSSSPNLQNILNADKMPVISKSELVLLRGEFNGQVPKGWVQIEEDRYRMEPVRRLFVPPEGWVWVVADFSQIELRMLALITKDKTLTNAYRRWDCECGESGETAVALHACPKCGAPDGERDKEDPNQPVKHGFCLGLDLHSMTGLSSGLFKRYGVKAGRKMAKSINFGLCYGKRHKTLARDLEVDEDEALRIYNAYFHLYPGVLHFHQRAVEDLKTKGEFPMVLAGRKRRFHAQKKQHEQGQLGMRGLNKTMRDIANNIPQGSASDILKLGILEYTKFKRQSPELRHTYTALQVHDEVVIGVKREFAELCKEKVVHYLERTVSLHVPILVDAHICNNWAEAK